MRMMPAALTTGLAIVATLALRAQAPARPDFSGVWTFEPSTELATTYGVLGDRVTIEQTDTAIVIPRPIVVTTIATGSPVRTTEMIPARYRFGERASPSPRFPCEVARADWDGPRLIIVRTPTRSPGCSSLGTESRYTLRLDAERRLVVEFTSAGRREGNDALPPIDLPLITVSRYRK